MNNGILDKSDFERQRRGDINVRTKYDIEPLVTTQSRQPRETLGLNIGALGCLP
jgi:hypothetical protein